MITIWHNSRCSKSREALNILEIHGREFEVFEYLKVDFSSDDIKKIIKLLKIDDVRDMLRKKEDIYKELNIKNELLSQDEIIELVVQNPKLVERPIIIKDEVAVIARPMDNLLNLIKPSI
ncbi:MAG: arsenate reductase (glutaredoxin) [Campylobacterota bacterium]|nr:arsenate reductase (glutaredoxin) [Campylobacterota bacterium]